LIGHLIFPLSLLLGKIFDKTNLVVDADDKKCKFLRENKVHCNLESYDFAKCLSKCLTNENAPYFNLWLNRFRAFNRFYRALVLPIIVLSVSLLLYGCVLFANGGSIKLSIFVMVVSVFLFASIFGTLSRSQKYNMRWRNGICSMGN
jgi:hypothetical protein